MQRQRSCQYTCSIHVYVVPMAVCTHVLYTLIVTVQLSFLSDRSEHRIHWVKEKNYFSYHIVIENSIKRFPTKINKNVGMTHPVGAEAEFGNRFIM